MIFHPTDAGWARELQMKLVDPPPATGKRKIQMPALQKSGKPRAQVWTVF